MAQFGVWVLGFHRVYGFSCLTVGCRIHAGVRVSDYGGLTTHIESFCTRGQTFPKIGDPNIVP